MRSVVDRSCTNQSCTMNWIHDAASRFRMRRGLELFACHELAADVPRVRDQQLGRVGEGLCERHVAAESAAGRAHARHTEIVV